jgi:hypothetical protein
VVGGHLVVAQPLTQLVGDPFCHPSRVHEDEGRPVGPDQSRDAIHDLGHLLGRRHRSQLVVRQLQGQIEGALVAHVDDRAGCGAVGIRPPGAGADQQAGDGFDRSLRRREPDPLRR